MSLKQLSQDAKFYSYNSLNSISLGAPPHVLLEEVTVLPQTFKLDVGE